MLSQLGKHREAFAVYQQALNLQPHHPQILTNLGIVAEQINDMRLALHYYDRALKADPVYQNALMNRGSVLIRLNRYDQAVENNRHLVAAYPDFPQAHFNLAESWLVLDCYDEALAACDRALALNPNYPKAHADRGLALAALGRFNEAQAAWQRAAAIDPQDLIKFFQGVSLNPDGSMPEIDARIVYVQKWMARQAEANWEGRMEFIRKFEVLLNDTIDGLQPVNDRALAHHSLFLPIDPVLHFRFVQHLARHIQQTVIHVRSPFEHRLPRTRKRLRLGYVSPDYQEHAVAHVIQRLFALHDRSYFEVYAYSLHQGDSSQYRRKLETTCDRFVELTDLDDLTAAEHIYDDEVDILIDLAGYTQHSRAEIFALRPAALQVSWLGYPSSLGAEFIDYCIADAIVVPAARERLFQEKLVYMPYSYQIYNNHQSIADRIDGRAALGLPEFGFVFCCFNLSLKIEPVIFTLWMRLLRRVPGSVLWLVDPGGKAKNNLRREAQAQGVAAERLRFAARDEMEIYLARYRLADLFLDTLLYNAHSTASDALWAGLPVLTCPGETFASRVAASVVTAAGLPEMVCKDLTEYEARAAHLAAHPRELAAIRKKLQDNRATCALFDTAGFVRHLEAAYKIMWERAAAGLPPDSFSVPR